MDITAIVMLADRKSPLRLEQIDTLDPSAYQALVGGDIEALRLSRPEATMYVKKDGKLHGLRVNPRATVVASLHNDGSRGREAVYGDVLITGPADAGGYNRSVPAPYIELWFAARRFQVQFQVARSDEWWARNVVYEDVFVAYAAAMRLTLREPEVMTVQIVAVE